MGGDRSASTHRVLQDLYELGFDPKQVRAIVNSQACVEKFTEAGTLDKEVVRQYGKCETLKPERARPEDDFGLLDQPLENEHTAKRPAGQGVSAQGTLKPIPFKWKDPATLPKRRWIYNEHYLRKFATGTFAPGGAGKSSLVIAEALAIVTGRPILGVQPVERCIVWLFNGEDPLEELERRVTAVMLAHGIAPEEVEGRLFLGSGRDTRLVLAKQTKDGAVVQAPVENELILHIRENSIGVVIIDPFVSSHDVGENDNSAVDMVAKTWGRIADRANCSVELVHHTRKLNGNGEPSIDDGRGASDLALRSCRLLVRMSKEEAKSAGVGSEARWRYLKIGNGKVNMVPYREKQIGFSLYPCHWGMAKT